MLFEGRFERRWKAFCDPECLHPTHFPYRLAMQALIFFLFNLYHLTSAIIRCIIDSLTQICMVLLEPASAETNVKFWRLTILNVYKLGPSRIILDAMREKKIYKNRVCTRVCTNAHGQAIRYVHKKERRSSFPELRASPRPACAPCSRRLRHCIEPAQERPRLTPAMDCSSDLQSGSFSGLFLPSKKKPGSV